MILFKTKAWLQLKTSIYLKMRFNFFGRLRFQVGPGKNSRENYSINKESRVLFKTKQNLK